MGRNDTTKPDEPTSSAADAAYKFIREGILDSRWAAKTHLRELELARLTGVSRTPVREALRRLEADGLVTLVPNLGARVNTWSSKDLDEIFGLREMLESHAAKLAAMRVEPSEINELKQLCDLMEGAASTPSKIDLQALSVYNERFHSLLMQASGNRRLQHLLKQVVEMPLVIRTFAHYSRRDLTRSLAHHREMTEALAARDGDWAAAVMRAHVRAGRAVFADAGDKNA